MINDKLTGVTIPRDKALNYFSIIHGTSANALYGKKMLSYHSSAHVRVSNYR